jgi:hypothetical protein
MDLDLELDLELDLDLDQDRELNLDGKTLLPTLKHVGAQNGGHASKP